MPGVFQPLSSSPIAPPSLASVLSSTQDSLFAEKKAHFVTSYLCSVQDSDERATAYGFTGLTYSLRSPASNRNPAPSRGHSIYISEQSGLHIRYAALLSNLFVIQKKKSGLISSFLKRKCRAGLCVGCSYYPVFLVIKRQTQRTACSTRQLGPCAISAVLELS